MRFSLGARPSESSAPQRAGKGEPRLPCASLLPHFSLLPHVQRHSRPSAHICGLLHLHDQALSTPLQATGLWDPLGPMHLHHSPHYRRDEVRGPRRPRRRLGYLHKELQGMVPRVGAGQCSGWAGCLGPGLGEKGRRAEQGSLWHRTRAAPCDTAWK